MQRARQAAATGGQTLVSACQQYERTLSRAARATRVRIQVRDVMEVVLEALRQSDA